MRPASISLVPYRYRVDSYRAHMAQAKLSAPVEPIRGYSLHPFYAKQRQWTAEVADVLSRLYRYTTELERAARQFAPSRRGSLGNAAADGTAPDVEVLLRRTRQLAERYNRLQRFWRERPDSFAPGLDDTFSRITRAAQSVLPAYGIRLQQDGSLDVDDAAFRQGVTQDFSGFEQAMQDLSQSFRQVADRLQAAPPGVFSRRGALSKGGNPYESSLLPNLFFRHAASTGLFLNQLW
ncbi:hypothetical protein [Brevibacillus thermoruber]|uniref:hypothetical protein n=1 Tax=Brevibacillus thermoruber TaxID=33942 RepID=UPI0005522F29|nr:hypothetical protein [Brevibacillus thermoruber]